MRRTILLDGAWERRDFLDEAWRWSDALRGTADLAASEGPPVQAGVSAGWRPARVPGSAIDDAWRAGEIPNPYVDRNSLAAEWIPQRTWVYRRRVSVPADAPPGADLRFEGIDPGGTVFLDGEEVARHSGMFVPIEINLDGRLAPGSEHELVVVVDSAPDMPSQVGRSELARHHRSRMGYGWDFCPRMVHTGIWRSVRLQLYRARIGRVRLAVGLEPDGSRARVDLEVALDGETDGARLVARLHAPNGAPLAEAAVPVDGSAVRIGLEVEHPELWWPNGLGEPALHRLVLVLDAADQLDERTVSFGFRSVAMAPTDGRTDALPYTLVVNGRPTWIRGWNWVPLDAAYGVPRPDRLRHLVELARRANVNLLRVWGGGLIESDEFYDACDAAGIMVWQEFAQSSSGLTNAPPEDPEFVELMRREAAEIVPLRAHHPSLVIWCGGNELAGPDRPLDDAHPVLAALREVVMREDPSRIWLPTSPTGPRFDNSLAAVAEEPRSLHDVHGPWEHQGLAEQHALAGATSSLLHSEFGTEGLTNPETLAATVTDADAPLDRSNSVMTHRGAWWINEPFVQRAFGGGLGRDELIRASQHLQADGLRTLIEGDRRRWPRNAGALPWQLNEPFPNAWCTSAVDWFGIPKAAYFAVAEAYAPLYAGVAFDSPALDGAALVVLRPWIANDHDRELGDVLRLDVHDAAGRTVAEWSGEITAAPNAVTAAGEVSLPLAPRAGDGGDGADLLVLDATFGAARSRRILSRGADMAPIRHVPPAELDARIEVAGDCWTLHLEATGAMAALEVRIADARPLVWPERTGHAYPEANFVTLLPGEERSIRIDWREVDPADRRLSLTGWNVEPRDLAGA